MNYRRRKKNGIIKMLLISVLVVSLVGFGFYKLKNKLFLAPEKNVSTITNESVNNTSDEIESTEVNSDGDNVSSKTVDTEENTAAGDTSAQANSNDSDTSTIEVEKTNVNSNEIIDSPVFARVNSSAIAYDGYSDKKKTIGEFNENDKVEIIKDRGTTWYKLKRESDGFVGWVYKDKLEIPNDPKTNENELSTEEIENFINSKKYSSKTNNFIWVNIDRQKTYIFDRNNESWKLIKTFTSGTGLNISPTVRGLYEIGGRGDSFYSERFKSGAKYWTRFYGPYLFHSVTMDKDGNVIDPTLGKRVSNGCIRLSVDDASWINKIF